MGEVDVGDIGQSEKIGKDIGELLSDVSSLFLGKGWEAVGYLSFPLENL